MKLKAEYYPPDISLATISEFEVIAVSTEFSGFNDEEDLDG